MKAKSLDQYHQQIKDSIDLPSMLSKLQVEASADFARYSEMYAEHEIKRAKFIKSLTDNETSVASAENQWITTEEGGKWMYLKHYLSGLKQITKAIDSATYTANMGAKNLN